MSCGKPPYYWECPECSTRLTHQRMTETYSTFYCDTCGECFCIDGKGRYYENEDDAGPLLVRQMEYISIIDICNKFNLNIRDFIFEEDFSNGDFIWFPCHKNAREEYKEDAEDYEGSKYAQRYLNDLMLAEYLVEEMGIADGVMLHMCW